MKISVYLEGMLKYRLKYHKRENKLCNDAKKILTGIENGGDVCLLRKALYGL